MSGMIDFHSHVLPQVDDGSDSMETTMRMLRMESEQGVDTVVATPHFYAQHDALDRFLDRRNAAGQRLWEILDKERGFPKVLLGAEVAFYPGISESDDLRKLSIAGSEYVLVEMPAPPWTEAMYRELLQLKDRQGLTPVLAHIDRYLMPFQVRRMMDRLEELPVVVQANASFFLQPAMAGTALRLLREGRIHLLGSDCHNLSSRAPNLGLAARRICRKLGPRTMEEIAQNGRKILFETVCTKGKYYAKI